MVVAASALLLGACTSSQTDPAPEVGSPTTGVVSELPPLADLEGTPVDLSDSYTWTTLSSGAGGFVTGMSVDPTGATLVARTDVGGAYLWDREAEVWAQLVTESRVADPEQSDYFVASAVVAPSDPNRIYLASGTSVERADGRLLVSTDGGTSFQVGASGLALDGNAEFRNGAERLAVDPTNPDEVWLAAGRHGLLFSTDAGTTFVQVTSGLPPADEVNPETLGVMFVVAGSDGQSMWAGYAGAGVFFSSDNGGNWSQIYSTEGTPVDAELDVAGRLWVVEALPGQVMLIADGEAKALSVDSDSTRVLVTDPADADVAYVGASGLANGKLWRTDDGGSSWRSITINPSCPTVPWLDEYDKNFFPTGSLLIDPIDQSMWFPEGFGIWRSEGDLGDSIDVVCHVEGVEELVSNDVVIPRGGNPVTAHWDRAIFYHGSDDTLGAIQGPTPRFNSAWDLAWSESQPSFLAAVVADHRFCCEGDGEAYASGWSDDGGKTWTRFASYDNGSHPVNLRFGNIAVSSDDPDNIVWVPTFNRAVHFTTDRGASWQPVVLPGTESMLNEDGDYEGGSHFAYYLNRQILVADPFVPSAFYLYQRELGIFRSEDGGANWQQLPSTGLPVGWPAGYFNATLVASPERAGHLFFAPGKLVEGDSGLYESTDGGATWTLVNGVTSATALGFGAGETPDSDPILYFAGTVNGQYGVYRLNSERVIDLLSTAPNGIYQRVKTLGADVEEYGTVVVGFEGTSFAVGRLN